MTERPGSLGLKVLYKGSNPSIDIVAVHGLGATPDCAWIRKVQNGDQEVLVNWLADRNMLPAKLPNSRIMTFNYESKWLLGAPMQRRHLCAIQLLTAIDNKRKEEKDTRHRPLIFIGHSFGGVVIEQSMVSANNHHGYFQYLALSTVGIIFLGTPHRGTRAARWGDVVARTGNLLGLGSETSILRDLQADSKNLRDLLYEFTLWANRARLSLVCYFEQYATDYGKRFGMSWKELVVDETSACIDGHRKVPLPTDHLKINKFSGPDDPSYIAVYPLIVHMAQDANFVVQGRMNPQTIVKNDSGIPEKHMKCLHALFLTDPQDDLEAIRSAKGNRVHGTCEWVLTHSQYTSWLVKEGSRLLWLSGAPGIGKTMTSTFLVKELTLIAERSPQMTLAYYFCDDKYEKRRTATAILRGLLLQILRQRPVLFKHIQPSFDMSHDGLFETFHALWRNFVAIVNDPDLGEVCCLVDALDECEKDSRQLFLVEFTKFYCSQKSKSPFVKFIITSRRENDIVESLSAVNPPIWHIKVDSGKVNYDVFKFIDTRVNELSTRKGYTAKLKSEIKSALTNKAEGTFLYVSLVLSILEKTRAQSLVREKLQNLPEDLNKLYDKILSQIDPDCEEIAIFVFRWVAVARRPLTVKELAMARALSTSRWKVDTLPPYDFADEFEDIYKCCEPFVYLDTDHDTINLVHQSAKDYLLGEYLQAKESLSQFHIVSDSTNLLIFKTCWRFLNFEEFKQGTRLIKLEDHCLCKLQSKLGEHFFLRYVRPQWQEHAVLASPALATDSRFWNEDLAALPTLRDDLLLRAVVEGQYVIVQRLLENGAQINSRDASGRTSLSLASREGLEKILELLLEWGNAGINSPNLRGQTPLHEAAEAGHITVVKLLLSQDCIAANSTDNNGATPLLWAARKGHEVVGKLILSQDDTAINLRDKPGMTPLLWAAAKGHERVIRLLVSRDDIEVNSQDRYGRTPLSRAARNGYAAVVRLLLSRDDIDINLPDEGVWPALMWGISTNSEAVVRLLLSRSDIEVRSRDLEEVRSWALEGYDPYVKLLEQKMDELNEAAAE